MRTLTYSVAMSLDGYIAAEDGGYDWIVVDPDIDFGALAEPFDALMMGRGTYEIAGDGGPGFGGMACYVASTTLEPDEHPGVTVVREDVEGFVADLKRREGKDIWLFGGGVLFRSLLEAGLVDRVEVGVIPVLLGQGVQLLPGLEGRTRLRLDDVRTYPVTGTVRLRYEVARETG